MTCPHYQGGTNCGFKPDIYEVTEKTVKTFCNGDYTKCPVFIQKVYPNSQEAHISRLKTIVDRIERKTNMPGVKE